MRVAKTAEQLKEWESHQKTRPSSKNKPFVKSTSNNKGEVWVSYRLSTNMGFHQKQRYEWFCAGFLLYYDDIVRNAAIDHIITFDWTGNGVDIYLYPAPDRPVYENGKKMKYPGWNEQDPQQLLSSYADTSDPPPPPPPPPPPMD